jgi:hypothetical protein
MTARDDKEETMSTAWIRITEDETRWQDDTGERMCWPSIVQYTDGDVIADTPDALPDPAVGYHHVVHDLEAKELLEATGLLYDGRHRGAWAVFRDARDFPGT